VGCKESQNYSSQNEDKKNFRGVVEKEESLGRKRE